MYKNNNDDIMTAEEFFGIGKERKAPRRRNAAVCKQGAELFAEIKIKLVMRLYGVTRDRAVKIIEERGIASRPPETGKDRSGAAMAPKEEEEFIDDFFAEV